MADRSWIWMAIFSVIFLVLGGLELSTGDFLAAAGYLTGGAGGALVTEGQRRGPEAPAHRSLTVAGTVALALGAALLLVQVVG